MLAKIELSGLGKTLGLSKVTAARLTSFRTGLQLDELPDKTWRMIYNSNLIPDFTKVKSWHYDPASKEVTFEGIDLKMKVSKAISIDSTSRMIHLDETPNGTWRLIFDKETIPDIKSLTCFKMLREV